jgi:hypothetical protein
VALALIIGSTVRLPVFAASIAATVTVKYARSSEYPLVCVTPLSDAGIMKGFILAALRQYRSLSLLDIYDRDLDQVKQDSATPSLASGSFGGA